MKFFICGFVLMLIIYIVRVFTALLIFCKKKGKFSDYFEFAPLQLLVDCFFLGVIFFGANYIITNDFLSIIEHLLYVLLIALIPSYVFLVKPILYLTRSKNFVELDEVSKFDGVKYRVKIMKSDDANAYAIGVLPWSKTILLGKSLPEHLDKEELRSIQLHEEGHLVKNHIAKLLSVNLLVSFLFYLILTVRFSFFEFDNSVVNMLSIVLIGCLYGVMVWYVPGKVQYLFELQADYYSVKKNGKENLINALRKLDTISNGQVSQGGVTHPTLDIRINEINKCA